MVRCEKCRFHYYIHNESWCDYIVDFVREDSSCEHGEFPEDYSEPQTNYDRIISKTPEELAEMFVEYDVDCFDCPNYGKCDGSDRCCKQMWLDWLRDEAKE